jgi:type I restriction enzyme S subunit
MRLRYKRLGDYIERCDEFNVGMQVDNLQGISNNKHFQRSHTNTTGIDLSAYRVVRRGQFAFNRATTRNGDKISIALREDVDCMVSPSYRIFRSKDENDLNSEYLMMWFRRSEFDRYSRFKSHGSAHEFFDYEEMCEVMLPIPDIEIQREIVKEYNTIVNRIKLNEQLIQKLEETAKALYKHWFVDFEFPDENGRPYKSSGGEMVFNEELKMEVPIGWTNSSLESIVNKQWPITYGVVKPGEEDIKGVKFIRSGDINEGKILFAQLRTITVGVSNQFKRTKLEGGEVLLSIVGNPGQVAIVPSFLAGSNIARQVALIKVEKRATALYVKNYLTSDAGKFKIADITIGSVQDVINLSDLRKMQLPIPNDDILKSYSKLADILQVNLEAMHSQTELNLKLREMLFAKMSKN